MAAAGPWQWPARFAGRPLDILAPSAVQPRTQQGRGYVLGRWDSEDLVSPIEDELKLRQLVALLDRVVDRCLQTLSATSEQLCCWLKSYHQMDYFPRPFGPLQTAGAQRGYTALWKRLLCFVFRAWSTPRPLRDAVYGIEFSAAQEALMAQIWLLLDTAEEVNGTNDVGDDGDDDSVVDMDVQVVEEDDEDIEDDEEMEEGSTQSGTEDDGLSPSAGGTVDLNSVLGRDRHTSLEPPLGSGRQGGVSGAGWEPDGDGDGDPFSALAEKVLQLSVLLRT